MMHLRTTAKPSTRRVLMAAAVVVLALAGLSVTAGAPGSISTMAGSKTFCGDGGPRLGACFNLPTNLVRDAAGNIYVADNANHRVRKIAANGIVTTYAGNGAGAQCGDGGPATSACLDFPLGLALDSADNLYIADSNNDRVRKVDTLTKVITTVAGGGVCTLPNVGDGALATNACLDSPRGLAVDGSGNLYIADARHNRVRRVDAGTQVITTVAGTGTAGTCGDGGDATAACLNRPRGLAMTAGGDLYIADETNRRIRRLSGGLLTTVAGGGTCIAPSVGDGGQATDACLNSPRGVAVDGTGQIYIADSGNDRVRRVAIGGVITTIAGNGTDTYCGDGGPAASGCISGPDDVLLDGAGGYLVVAAFERRIRAVSAGGTISTYAGIGSDCGDAGPAVNACLGSPQAVVVGPDGYTYVADTSNHRVRRVSPTGTITAFAGTGVPGFCGDGGAATSACLFFPRGLAFDSGGNLYIADSSNNRIRKVTPAGAMSTYAGNGTPGFCGDGGTATSACLYLPRAVAVSPATGEIYIGDTTNERIRKVDGAGTITTIAGTGVAGYCGDGGPAASACIDSPRAMTFDTSANLYFADSVNDRVRKIDPTGTITNVAGNGLAKFTGDGGQATLASIDRPEGVAVDAGGNLYISDHFSGRVRVVSAGIITTFAGKATGGFCGDGGIATNACLSLPRGLAISGGDLLIADSGNARVRRVAAPCAGDNDCDGFMDPAAVAHQGPANTSTAVDNCPFFSNTSQLNTDGNFIDQTPPSPQDDKTWPNSDAIGDACDTDNDNDGLTDTAEASGAACAGTVTNSLLRDTDGDRVLDGPECTLGTNPTSATSKPTAAQCGLSIDTDGDRISDRAEFCGYGTNPGNTDSDGDNSVAALGAKDGCEAASINGDRVVNSGDQLLLVLEILRDPSPALRLVSMDVNKDGAVNVGDQLLLALFISPGGQCP